MIVIKFPHSAAGLQPPCYIKLTIFMQVVSHWSMVIIVAYIAGVTGVFVGTGTLGIVLALALAGCWRVLIPGA